MNDEMRALLAEYIRKQNDQMGNVDFSPPQGAARGPDLPQAGLRSRGSGFPAVSAEHNVPLGEGELTMQGGFHKPNAQARPDWSAMLGYRRQF